MQLKTNLSKNHFPKPTVHSVSSPLTGSLISTDLCISQKTVNSLVTSGLAGKHVMFMSRYIVTHIYNFPIRTTNHNRKPAGATASSPVDLYFKRLWTGMSPDNWLYTLRLDSVC